MRRVVEGLPNKLIADQLAISVRTVEVHRARVFEKMEVKSAVELAKNPTQQFNAVNGAIATLNGDGTFTVTQLRADGPVVAAGTYTVDASHAVFMEGNASCLAVGQTVQAIGSLMQSTMTAKIVNVKGCAGEKHAEPAPPAPAPHTTDDAPRT